MLDDVIQKIDESLPAIHRMCRIEKKQKKTPASRLPPDKARLAKARFQEMREDPLLNEEGTDVKLPYVNGASRSGTGDH